MKKILPAALIIGVIAMPLSAEAFTVKNFFNFLKSNSDLVTVDSSTSLSDLNKKLSSIDSSLQTSFIDLVSLLSSTKDSLSIKTRLASIKANLKATEAEKSAMISELLSNYVSNLKSNKQTVIANIKNMTAAEKTELANDLISMAKSGSEYLALAKDYADAASKASKAAKTAKNVAENASKLKKSAETIAANAKTIAQTTSTIAGILQSSGVKTSVK